MSLSVPLPTPPTTSLPSLRSLEGLTGDVVFSALRNLYALYCPVSSALIFPRKKPKVPLGEALTPLVDSGYVSGDDGEQDDDDGEVDALESLRADAFERNFAERWLTGFIARAESLPCWSSNDECETAVDQASYVLASFSTTADEPLDGEDEGLLREFSFALGGSSAGADQPGSELLQVRLVDKPISTGTDHTDVGLQSWGASIIFSDLICGSPERFGLTRLGSSPQVLELGAGTGLVGLTLARLLPRLGAADANVVATDYHPAVLENLRENVAANCTPESAPRMEVCLLDWSAPSFEPPLDKPADMIVATDVVYAPEHAVWLRDCVGRYLAPNGSFWLMATVRENGKFEGISNTVQAAFTNVDDPPRAADGRVLMILGSEKLAKRSGVGRGDESGYNLFRIGWAAA
ncbi:putative methyltransferase-domain-containing protein [Xylariales sp. PMI_506]|nr:putative methyltransferase-domain-containing protein [Xylariales sp. PMI_506]